MAGAATLPGSHIDAPLSNYLAAFPVLSGIADLVCPPIPVKRRTDRYYAWDKAAWLRNNVEEQRRARGAEPRVIEPTLSDSAYVAVEYEIATMIADEDLANTDSILRLEQAKTAYTLNAIRIAREVRVANLLRLAANGGGLGTNGTTLSGVNQWDNASFTAVNLHSNIMTAIEAIRSVSGVDPNTIVIPKAVAAKVVQNTDIKTMISYQAGDEWLRAFSIGQGSSATGSGGNAPGGQRNYLPNTLWGLNVLEPSMVYSNAAEGAAFAANDVWGKDVRVMYVNPSLPMMEVPSVSYTFRSSEYGTAGINVRRYRKDGNKANYYAVGVVDAEVVTAAELGYVIAAAIS